MRNPNISWIETQKSIKKNAGLDKKQPPNWAAAYEDSYLYRKVVIPLLRVLLLVRARL